MVFKGENEFITKPKYKDTHVARPLCASSAHPLHVHLSWPRALASRTEQLSSNQKVKVEAIENLKMRLKMNFAPQGQLDLVSMERQVIKRRDAPDKRDKRMWLPLSFHPGWARQLQSAIRFANEDEYLHLLYSLAFGMKSPRVSLAWQNALPRIQYMIQEKLCEVR